MTKRPTPDACSSSIRARAETLEKYLRSSGAPPAEILNGCKSIAAFQRLSLKKLGITPIGSRNTLVKYANLVLAESAKGLTGWEYLNALRKRVDRKFRATNSRSTKAREQRMQARAAKLQRNLDQTERLMFAQSKAYLSLLQEVAGLARARNVPKEVRERLYVLLKSHNDTFGHLFESGTDTGATEMNVVSLRSR